MTTLPTTSYLDSTRERAREIHRRYEENGCSARHCICNAEEETYKDLQRLELRAKNASVLTGWLWKARLEWNLEQYIEDFRQPEAW